MEITKEKLMSIIKESNLDVDEMALRQKKTQAPRIDKSTGELRVPKSTPGWFPNNPTQPGQEGIPDYWVVNPNQIKGQDILAVPLDCDELEAFVEKNKQFLDEIKVLHNLEPQLISCSRGKFHRPVLDYYGKKWQDTGNREALETRIKRKFNPIIESELDENGENARDFNEVLNKLSIPTLITNDEKYTNNHSDVWTNERIRYEALNFNSYNSSNDFLRAVVARIYGQEAPEMKTYSLSRQFNQKYDNWDDLKKQDQRYEGKTNLYNLDRRGYEEMNLDVALKSHLQIDGVRQGNQWTWKISLKVKMGRKRPDEYRIRSGNQIIKLKDNGILDDQTMSVSKTVDLDPNKQYEAGNNTIMDDIAVNSGLREAISDFKQMLMDIVQNEPNKALEYANYTQADVVNENFKKILTKKVIEQLKK